jgi:hypothetical protein
MHTSFVLGFHGCSKVTGEAALSGDLSLIGSEKDYDWLGPGIYFWESDAKRAWEWADAKVSHEEFDEAFVIGAVVDLGNCLDMMSRDSMELLREAYDLLAAATRKDDPDRELPTNAGRDKDKLLRYLDCAVIRTLHKVAKPSFDSVRGLFTEGDELFPGSGFKKKTHVQISVCNPDSIKGVFRVSRQ